MDRNVGEEKPSLGHSPQQLGSPVQDDASKQVEEEAEGEAVADTGPPDGGARAWSVICSSSLVLFCVFGFGMFAQSVLR